MNALNIQMLGEGCNSIVAEDDTMFSQSLIYAAITRKRSLPGWHVCLTEISSWCISLLYSSLLPFSNILWMIYAWKQVVLVVASQKYVILSTFL
jgi:hypothetical protein